MPLDAGPRDDLKRLRVVRQVQTPERLSFAAWPKPLRDVISALLRDPGRPQ